MNFPFSHSPPSRGSLSSSLEPGPYKRQRSGSVSGRLRSASDLCEDGTISASQKGLVKDLIISGDPALAEALEAYERGEKGPIKRYLASGVLNRRSSIDLVAELGVEGLDMNMFDFQTDTGRDGGSSFDDMDDMDMPFSFYDDPAIGSRGHAPSFSIEGDLGNGGGATGKDGGGNPPRERTFSQIFDTTNDNLFGDLGDDAGAEFHNSFHSGSIDVTDYEALLEGGGNLGADVFRAGTGGTGSSPSSSSSYQKKKKAPKAPKAPATKKKSGLSPYTSKTKAKKGQDDKKKYSAKLDLSKKNAGSVSGKGRSAPMSIPGSKGGYGKSSSSTTSKVSSTYGGATSSGIGSTGGGLSLGGGGVSGNLTIGVNQSTTNDDGTVRVGAYSPASRRARIARFMAKRKKRIWTKRVKYDVRKNFADSRLRVKGRFVKKEDEELLRELMNMT